MLEATGRNFFKGAVEVGMAGSWPRVEEQRTPTSLAGGWVSEQLESPAC